MQYVTVALSAISWLAGSGATDRSHVQIKALPLCALFALIPALPERTLLGLDKHSIVGIQLENKIGDIPGMKKPLSWQAFERMRNGDSKEDSTLFNAAVMEILNKSGKHALTKSLLTRTSEGLKKYSFNYDPKKTAHTTLNNLAILVLKELEVPSDQQGEVSPIEDDRMASLVRLIEDVYARKLVNKPYGPEISAALAYIKGLQQDDSNVLLQNQNVEVPT
jgi:hypothetical protein